MRAGWESPGPRLAGALGAKLGNAARKVLSDSSARVHNGREWPASSVAGFERQDVMRTSLRRPVHGGFTLVELLVVIGIIALLISILMPALSRARDHANRVACLSNIRQIGLAFRMYAGENRDWCPFSAPLGTGGLSYCAGSAQLGT